MVWRFKPELSSTEADELQAHADELQEHADQLRFEAEEEEKPMRTTTSCSRNEC